MDSRRGWRSSCPRRMAATSKAAPNWRWTPTARCWPTASARWPMSAPIPAPPGSSSSCMIGPWVSTSIYDIRTIDFDMQAVLTNTAPTAAYRGAGRPEAIYLIERLFDVAAQKLGLDPAEIRRRNLIAPEQMPYTNAMGQVYDSGKFGSILRAGAGAGRLGRFPDARGGVEGARQAARARPGVVPGMDRRQRVRGARDRLGLRRRRDRGLCLDHADGAGDRHVLRAACGRCVRRGDRTHPHRHGRHRPRPGLRQRRFALAVHRRLGDQPCRRRRAVANGRDLAAEALEAAAADIEYAEGVFRIAGTDRGIGLFELAERQPERRIYVDSTSKVAGPSWPNGCHVCRGRGRSGDRGGGDRVLRLGQRRRPRGQPDDRARPARRRRGAGHRPGPGRAHAVRPRVGPGDDRQHDGLLHAARGHHPRLPCMCWTSPSPAATTRWA